MRCHMHMTHMQNMYRYLVQKGSVQGAHPDGSRDELVMHLMVPAGG
jgi:hypothetical protein